MNSKSYTINPNYKNGQHTCCECWKTVPNKGVGQQVNRECGGEQYSHCRKESSKCLGLRIEESLNQNDWKVNIAGQVSTRAVAPSAEEDTLTNQLHHLNVVDKHKVSDLAIYSRLQVLRFWMLIRSEYWGSSWL